jgi:hypothetical protein
MFSTLRLKQTLMTFGTYSQRPRAEGSGLRRLLILTLKLAKNGGRTIITMGGSVMLQQLKTQSSAMIQNGCYL